MCFQSRLLLCSIIGLPFQVQAMEYLPTQVGTWWPNRRTTYIGSNESDSDSESEFDLSNPEAGLSATDEMRVNILSHRSVFFQ